MRFARAEPTGAIWLLVILLTLIWHWLIFWAGPVVFGEWSAPKTRQRWLVEPIDSKSLAKIREKWKKLHPEGSLLLNKDPNPPDPSVAEPEDARYFSDRNTRVKKEQQARNQGTRPQGGGQAQAEVAIPKSLAKFGIPILKPGKDGQPNETSKRERLGEAGPLVDQSLLDEDLPVGAENLLNTRVSVHYSFYSRIYDILEPIWTGKVREAAASTQLSPGRYRTHLDVVANRKGEIIRIHLMKSSGVRVLDDAAIQSFVEMVEIPNPPSPLVDDKGEVHVFWSFQWDYGTNHFQIRYYTPNS